MEWIRWDKTMRRSAVPGLRAGLILACLLAISPPLTAQQSNESCSAASIVETLADSLEASYVLAEAGAEGAQQLRNWLATASPSLADGTEASFAQELTQVTRSATGDGHILIEWIDPAGSPADEADWIAQWRTGAPRANFGVPRVEVLPGNVGYVALRSFHTYANAAPTLRAAFELIRHTDALILDLRQNGGGDDETANAVIRTFLPEMVEWPLRMETRDSSATPAVPALPGWELYGSARPLAVLIDDRSFSAPEAVAYVLANAGRATIVGTRSAGGAHMIERATPLACGFQAWIPNRRPVHIETGTNWEGTGVTPRIEASGEAAIPTAHLHLLRELVDDAAAGELREEWSRIINELEQEFSPAVEP